MSYEGYRQILCKKGHYYTVDSYDSYRDSFYDGKWKCSICGEDEAWSNGVDTTNGSYDTNPDTGKEERIDGYVELEIDIPAKQCTCSCCGNTHQIAPATYKIPQEK